MAGYGVVIVGILIVAAFAWSFDRKARDSGVENLLERIAASRAGYPR
jgi:hypothetical protein